MKKNADWWHNEGDVTCCDLCPHACRVPDGKTGRCGVRRNIGGTLFAENYGRVSSVSMDPVEKKPLYHWRPGTRVLSFGTVGCSMACPFCQNWEIASWEPTIVLREMTVRDVVHLAVLHDARAVAFTYNEPLVWYEFVEECSAALRNAGITVVLVSNGMIRESPLRKMIPFLSAANIDVKSFDPDIYRFLGGDLETVVRNVELLHAAGIHTEITTLVVPNISDDIAIFDREIAWLASVSPDIPLHVTRYFPRHLWTKAPTTELLLEEMVRRAKKVLRYVYAGNIDHRTDSRCPDCDALLVARKGYDVSIVALRSDGTCAECGRRLPFIQEDKGTRHP